MKKNTRGSRMIKKNIKTEQNWSNKQGEEIEKQRQKGITQETKLN